MNRRLSQSLGHKANHVWTSHAKQNVRGTGRIDQRTKKIEQRPDTEFVPDGRNISKAGMETLQTSSRAITMEKIRLISPRFPDE